MRYKKWALFSQGIGTRLVGLRRFVRQSGKCAKIVENKQLTPLESGRNSSEKCNYLTSKRGDFGITEVGTIPSPPL